MKASSKIIFSALLASALQFLLSSCASGGGYASTGYVDTGVYYGPAYGDVWIHDDHWVDGHQWDHHPDPHVDHHDDYIHPPPYHGPPPNQHQSEPHGPSPASHGSPPAAPPHGQPPHESTGRDGR
jgi:hypothetical protein